MESKKDIGKLFKDHLEQLDFSPSTKVWEQIELDLTEKKKKRGFVIWFFLGTILLIGLLGGFVYTFSNGNSLQDQQIQEKTNPTATKTTDSNPSDVQKKVSEVATNTILVTPDSAKNSEENSSVTIVSNKKNTAAKLINRELKTIKCKVPSNRSKATLNYKKRKSTKKERIKFVISSFSKIQKNKEKKKFDTTKVSTSETEINSKNDSPSTKNSIAESAVKQIPNDSIIVATNSKEITKKDIKEKDSLPINDTVIETKQKIKDYEIIIAPYYGMNYNGYFGDFDAISNNTILQKEGAVRATFGVVARWMFDDKLGFQIGVGKINSHYLVTVDKQNSAFINTQNVATELPINELNGIFTNAQKVKFSYESSYLEVPLEAYYVVRDKKIGLATSLGVSFLFDGKNSIFAESEVNSKMKIGSLTTTPGNGATANAKLYLFYKITPSLQLDLYPSFQYQIMGNTDSSNYSSYFFSIRTGLSYKF